MILLKTPSGSNKNLQEDFSKQATLSPSKLDVTPQHVCCHLAAFLMLETIYIFNHIKEKVCGHQTGEVFALSRGALSASRAAFLILFYLFFFFFFTKLMSVTATGNKMLVRVCAVASQRQL